MDFPTTCSGFRHESFYQQKSKYTHKQIQIPLIATIDFDGDPEWAIFYPEGAAAVADAINDLLSSNEVQVPGNKNISKIRVDASIVTLT